MSWRKITGEASLTTQVANLPIRGGVSPGMKKLLLAAALCAAAIAPTTASAQDPDRADFKNAAEYCKEFRDGAGQGELRDDVRHERRTPTASASRRPRRRPPPRTPRRPSRPASEAVEECRAVKTPGSKNAFGKCVSEKAKAKKAAADKEDEAQEDDKINAAKTCKAAKKADAEQFGEDCGTKKNAFGKCVSTTAKELAAERKAEREAAPTA